MQLSDPVTLIPGIGPSYQKLLLKLNIHSIADLLNHFPRKYLDFSHPTDIANLQPNSLFCLKATIVSSQSIRTRTGKTMQKATIRDRTGTLTLTWFNQPFLLQTLKAGETFFFVGSTKENNYFVTPLLQEPANEQTLHTNRIVPFHPLTHGVSGKWLRTKIHLCLSTTDIPEVLPSSIIEHHQLTPLNTSYQHIHFPQDPQQLKLAQTRFAFNELLSLQLRLLKTRQAWRNLPTHQIKVDPSLNQKFLSSLPFTPTPDQQKAIARALVDLSRSYPCNRLIQGDVGSGKTLIAMAAALQTVNSGHQVLILAPTQILATQHFDTFSRFLDPFSIKPVLVTAQTKSKNISSQPLLIGTHALLDRQLTQTNRIGLVVFDEQQRFGVDQRNFFVNRQHTPHHLSLTATPIPRTIAISLLGHLQVSNIKTVFADKKPIKTWLVPESKRQKAYDWISQQIQTNHTQAFYVCPAITPDSTTDDASSIKSAVALHQRLSQKVFPHLRVGLLHGKQDKDDQARIIAQYQQHQLDILVTTSIIEVGVDIKNANIMVIESADNFGLSQLHQLRGRVGRGVDQGYCLLFQSDQAESEQITRLRHLETIHDGFTLSRLDLQLRGSGHLFGTMQSGHLHTQLEQFWDKSLTQQSKLAALDLIHHHPTHQLVTSTPDSINLQT